MSHIINKALFVFRFCRKLLYLEIDSADHFIEAFGENRKLIVSGFVGADGGISGGDKLGGAAQSVERNRKPLKDKEKRYGKKRRYSCGGQSIGYHQCAEFFVERRIICCAYECIIGVLDYGGDDKISFAVNILPYNSAGF